MLTWSASYKSLYLCSVWKKDGWGQVACDATEHVDDGDPEPTHQLLYVPQHRHLEKHRHQAVQDPTHTETSFSFAPSDDTQICSHIKRLLETSLMQACECNIEFSHPAWRKRESQSLENWSGTSGLRKGNKPHTSSMQATWKTEENMAMLTPPAPVAQVVSVRYLYDSNLQSDAEVVSLSLTWSS